MKFAATSWSVVGGSDETHWGQTFIGKHFFLAVEVRGERASLVGKEFLTAVENQIEKRTITSLQEFKQLLTLCSNGNPAITYTGATLVNTIVYLVVGQAGDIWIKRDGKVAPIITSDGSASGFIKENDLILLGSESLRESVSRKDLIETLHLDDPTIIAETIAPKLHKGGVFSPAAALILSFHETIPETGVAAKAHFFPDNLGKLKQFFRFKKPQGFKIKSFPKVKPLALIIGLLVSVLIGSIFFGVLQQQMTRQQKELQETLTSVSHKFEEGMALVELNPIRARELLDEARNLLTAQLGKVSLERDKQTLLSFQQKISDGLSVALRRYEVVPNVFFEMNLVKPGGEGTLLSLYQDALAILDTKNATLYTLNIASKASRVVAAGDELKQARDISVYGEEIYVLGGQEVYRVRNGSLIRVVSNTEQLWGEINTFDVFGGNIYLLDREKNEIWKYLPTESGFSTPRNYVLPDTFVNLGNVSEMEINGSIWVVNGSTPSEFVQGQDQLFKIEGLDQPLGGRIDLYTDELLVNLYILDFDKQRIVVLDKDGVYLSQYVWQESREVIDFVVSEALKKILLLSSDTIYAIDLR